jgi:ABC-type antimicrobial peptide transport system permease subunit
VLQAIAAEPIITQYAAAWPDMMDTVSGFAAIGDAKAPLHCKFVSGAYFDVMGIPMLRGRPFTEAERDGATVAIVSESTARTLWPNGNAIGQSFRLEPDPPVDAQSTTPPAFPARVVTVVGVSRDVKGFRFNDSSSPSIFLPTSLDSPNTAVMARIVGNPDIARQTLIDDLIKIDPNLGMVVTMRTVAKLEETLLTIAFVVAVVLGSLALLLTVSGLFGVLSYLVAQRTREIGVRMALGASPRSVMRLTIAQMARPVLYGLIAGTALAAALAAALLATPLGVFIAPIVHVTDPVAYLTSVAIIVAACIAAAAVPAIRAAGLDPVRALRQN